MPTSLHDFGAFASILVLFILVLCYYNYIQLCCKVVAIKKEGYESNPVAGAALGNAANRAVMRSDGFGADVSGLAQASQDASDPSTRAAVVMGLATLPQNRKQNFSTHRLGFQGVMNEPPVFWNQGSLEEVAEYENSERMNMPSQNDLMQSDVQASLNAQQLLAQQAQSSLNNQAQAARQGFRTLSAY